jgi:hypothetical protein
MTCGVTSDGKLPSLAIRFHNFGNPSMRPSPRVAGKDEMVAFPCVGVAATSQAARDSARPDRAVLGSGRIATRRARSNSAAGRTLSAADARQPPFLGRLGHAGRPALGNGA